MSVITTPGSATANSYADIDEFKAYRDTRLPAVTWAASASDADIEVALRAAARVLDACFTWTGGAVDSTQALAWPRTGMYSRNHFAIPSSGATSIPQALKDAQCELALQMGAGDLLADNAAAQQGVASVSAGSVSVSFQSVNTSTEESVDMIIRRLGPDFLYVSTSIPGAVRMLLVPSWYEQTSIKRPIIFGAM